MIILAATFLGTLELIGLIVAAVVALGIVVFVHEWGHFMAGRWVGIRAEAFSIGFGPVVWRKQVGETEYRLSAILFGGYVKFAGMEGTADKTPQEIERGFFAVSPPRRILAAFSGPFMNAVMAFVLFLLLWGTGRKVPEGRATTMIGAVAQGSTAEEAGLQRGDRIVSISGHLVDDWHDVLMGVAVGGEVLEMAVERDGQIVHTMVRPKEDPEAGARVLPIIPRQRMSVYRVPSNTEAARMGLRQGDTLVSLNGEPVLDGAGGWQTRLRAQEGKPITIEVQRDGERVTLSGTMPTGTKDQPPTLGIVMAPVFAWIYQAPHEAVSEILGDVWQILKGLVTRRVKAKGLAGPVGIVSLFIYSLQVSFTSFLWFAALISLNLAIINLLPIPVVDGGHIMFSLIEAVRRKPVREKTLAIITNVFAALIILFFAYVTFHDVMRLFPSRGKEMPPAEEEAAPEQAAPEPAAPEPGGPETGPTE